MNSLIEKIFSVSVVYKAVIFKKGALLVPSALMSLGLLKAVKSLLKEVDPYDLILPVVSIVVCVLLYFMFWIVDMIWGLLASKYENRNNEDWITSEKLYSSIGKIGGLLLVDAVLLPIMIFLVIIGFVKTSVLVLIVSVIINVLAIFYEIHSIGENIKRRTGSKPPLFTLLDRMVNTIESSLINRVSKLIGGEQTTTSDFEENEIPEEG